MLSHGRHYLLNMQGSHLAFYVQSIAVLPKQKEGADLLKLISYHIPIAYDSHVHIKGN